MKRLHYRTIKDNQVRILGKTLHCSNLKHGELDGKRFAFIIYSGIEWEKRGLTCLWGTEAFAKAANAGELEAEKLSREDGKLLAPDGYLRWYWWQSEEDTTKTS